MLRNEIAANQPSNNVRGKEGNKKNAQRSLSHKNTGTVKCILCCHVVAS